MPPRKCRQTLKILAKKSRFRIKKLKISEFFPLISDRRKIFGSKKNFESTEGYVLAKKPQTLWYRYLIWR